MSPAKKKTTKKSAPLKNKAAETATSSEDTTLTRKVKCPRCGKESVYSMSNAFRPFCSERCRLMDFGQWANEAFRVPTEDGASVQDAPFAENENED